MRRHALASAPLLAILLVGCDEPSLTETAVDTPDEAVALEPEGAFVEAEDATRVPAALLVALAYAETGLQMVVGEVEFPGQERAYGIMALREGNLELAAELTGLDPELLKHHRAANVLGAAAVLSHWAQEEGIDTSDLAAWAPLVARYSGIENEQAVAEFVHRDVYGALKEGIIAEGFEVEPIDVRPNFPLPDLDVVRSRQSGTIWTPSPNYNSRGGASVDFVVIHTCEGSYSGCWGWLTNKSAGVSAHYVVNDRGTEVRQLVDENHRAWHISANYSCSNNHGVECWRNGRSMNTVSVGIEHAGYASQSSWNTGLLQRSAELTCNITKRHGIVRDRYHIVGHGQLQPWNRSDPGANWPWTNYIDRVKAACGSGGSSGGGGGGGTSGAIIIDSNNAANDTSRYYTEVGSGWWSSANVSGYYNTGYWVGPTASVSDPVSFWFKTTGTQCYQVEAWWTAAWDRPPAITFIGWDSAKREVGRKTVDQTKNGARWNHLGYWKFPAGWNQVLLSRWAASGDYAIADAVRLTPSTACP